MIEIIFNEVSAKELSELKTTDQLELLNEFKICPKDLENITDEKYGVIERNDKKLYRYRAKDFRIYFEPESDNKIIVHRVLHKNTFRDFMFRSSLPINEDDQLSKSKNFWELIQEGKKSNSL